jgi:hypothetical protein
VERRGSRLWRHGTPSRQRSAARHCNDRGCYPVFETCAGFTKDAILLTDFLNTTGDRTFDGTLRQALAINLEQSVSNIVSQARIRETLRFGQVSGRAGHQAIGRDLRAPRIKALLVGTVRRLAHGAC